MYVKESEVVGSDSQQWTGQSQYSQVRNRFILATNLNCKPQLSLFLMYIFSIDITNYIIMNNYHKYNNDGNETLINQLQYHRA